MAWKCMFSYCPPQEKNSSHVQCDPLLYMWIWVWIRNDQILTWNFYLIINTVLSKTVCSLEQQKRWWSASSWWGDRNTIVREPFAVARQFFKLVPLWLNWCNFAVFIHILNEVTQLSWTINYRFDALLDASHYNFHLSSSVLQCFQENGKYAPHHWLWRLTASKAKHEMRVMEPWLMNWIRAKAAGEEIEILMSCSWYRGISISHLDVCTLRSSNGTWR